MLETTDFFQRQAEECRILAERARDKNDKEYWLHLAQRWEWLVQQQTGGVSEGETVRPLRSGHSVLEKRFGKRRDAA